MEMESEYLQKLQRQLEETEQEMAELFSRRCQLVSKLHADQPPLPRLTKVQALDLEGKKAAYCGVPGAYGYEATVRFFGEEFEKVSVSSFDAALTAVDHGDADYAVLPIENSSAGAVGNVYDVLAEHPVTVVEGRLTFRSATACWPERIQILRISMKFTATRKRCSSAATIWSAIRSGYPAAPATQRSAQR